MSSVGKHSMSRVFAPICSVQVTPPGVTRTSGLACLGERFFLGKTGQTHCCCKVRLPIPPEGADGSLPFGGRRGVATLVPGVSCSTSASSPSLIYVSTSENPTWKACRGGVQAMTMVRLSLRGPTGPVPESQTRPSDFWCQDTWRQ